MTSNSHGFLFTLSGILASSSEAQGHHMLKRALHNVIRSRPLHTDSLPISTTAKGTAFENRCIEVLRSNLSMTLERVGGASDGGIDIQGWWWLPVAHSTTTVDPGDAIYHNDNPNVVNDGSFPRRRIRVLGQCKAESKKMSPRYIREMEGVVLRFMTDAGSIPPTITHKAIGQMDALSTLPVSPTGHHQKQPIVGLILSESAFTTQTTLRAMSSPVPFLLLHLPPTTEIPSGPDRAAIVNGANFDSSKPASRRSANSKTSTPALGSLLWNGALQAGLLGDEMEARWERSITNPGGRAALFWRGKRLPNWHPPNLVPP